MVPRKGYLINAELRERDPPTVSSECEHEPPPMALTVSKALGRAVDMRDLLSVYCHPWFTSEETEARSDEVTR